MPITRRMNFDWFRVALTLGAVALTVYLFSLDLHDPEPGNTAESTDSASTTASNGSETHVTNSEAPTASSATSPPTNDTVDNDRPVRKDPSPGSSGSAGGPSAAVPIVGKSQVVLSVHDEKGNPVAGVSLHLAAHYTYQTSRTGFVRSGLPAMSNLQATTDEEGAATLDDVPSLWGAQVFASTSDRAGRCKTLFLMDGHTYKAKIVLRPAAPIVLLVVDEDGNRIEGATVWAVVPNIVSSLVSSGGAKGFAWTPTEGETGRFVFPLVGAEPDRRTPTGSDGLVVHIEAPGHVPRTVRVPFAETKSVEHSFTLRRTVIIRGTVADSNEQPVVGAQVRIEPLLGGDSRLADWTARPPQAVTTDQEGGFEFTDVPATSVRILIESSDGSRLRIDVPSSVDPVIDVGTAVLRSRSRISGKVLGTDGAPVSGALVHLIDPVSHVPSGSVSTQSDGSFSIADAGAESHRLMATDRSGKVNFAAIRGSCDGVPAGAEDVVIQLSAARLLRLDVELAPQADGTISRSFIALVVLLGEATPTGAETSTWLQKPGAIRLSVEAPGIHTVQARAEGYVTFLGQVDVSDEQETVLRVKLVPQE